MRKRVAASIFGAMVLLGWCGAVWASEAGGHGEHALPWGDFVLRLLNFAVLLGVLVYLLKGPITSFFSSRRENIRKTLLELEQKKDEAEKKAAEYKGKLAALDQETEKIIAEYIQEGEMEKQRIIDAANRQAAYITEQAKLAVQQEIKAAKDDLQEEIASLSVAAAEEILKTNMKLDDHKRLVQEFLTKAVEAK